MNNLKLSVHDAKWKFLAHPSPQRILRVNFDTGQGEEVLYGKLKCPPSPLTSLALFEAY